MLCWTNATGASAEFARSRARLLPASLIHIDGGTSLLDAYKQLGVLTGRVLKGENYRATNDFFPAESAQL
jgi:hypothetical protein